MASSITVLNDVSMPNSVLLAGVSGQQIRRNDRGELLSGAQQVNVGRTRTKREFKIAVKPMPPSAWAELEAVYEVSDAGAYGIRMEDPKDSIVTVAQGVVASITSTTFRLYKRYKHTASTRYRDRKITRPRLSTVAVFVSGVAATFSVDDTTGIVTIAAAPSAANVTWSGRFDVPVHFQSDVMDWDIIGSHQDPESRYVEGTGIILEEILE